MTVYVDEAVWPWKGKKWAHLMADSLDELHDFAKKLGLQRNWYQYNARHAHYDVTESKRELALKLGAKDLAPFEERDLYKKVIDNAKRIQKERRATSPRLTKPVKVVP